MKVKYVDENNCLWGKQLYLYENDGVVVTKDAENVYFINKGNQILVADKSKVVFEGYLHNPGKVYYEKMDDEEIIEIDKLGKVARENLKAIDKTGAFMTLSNKKLDFLPGYNIERHRVMDGNFLNVTLDITRESDKKEFNYRFLIDDMIRPSLIYDKTDDEDTVKLGERVKLELESMTGLKIETKQIEKQKVKRI